MTAPGTPYRSDGPPAGATPGEQAPTGPGARPGGRRIGIEAGGNGRWILLAACLVACVRFFRLGEWSLWHDEALALSDALGDEVMQNPLGYLLFGLLFQVFDERPNETWLRLLPAILGVLSAPLTYWAFRPFAGGRRAAAAALLVAVSSWHVYWSQNARFYTLAQDLGLVGGALMIRGLWNVGSPRRGAALAIAGTVLLAAACSAHPSAVFLLVGLLVAPWVARGIGMRPPVASGGPWLAILGTGVVLVVAGAGWGLEVWQTWVGKKASSPAHLLLTTGFYVTPLLGIGVLVGAGVSLRRREAFGVTAFLVCVVGLLGALVAGLLARMSAQYVFVLLPWLAIVAAAPVDAVRPRAGFAVPAGLGLGYLVLLVLPSLADLSLYFTVRNGDRPRWREAYRYVFENQEPGDLVLGMEAPVGEYYLSPDPTRTDVRDWRHVTFLDHFRAGLPDEWSRYPRRTWFVVNLEQLEDWGGEERAGMLRTLRTECRLQKTFPVRVAARDLDVLVFVRD